MHQSFRKTEKGKKQTIQKKQRDQISISSQKNRNTLKLSSQQATPKQSKISKTQENKSFTTSLKNKQKQEIIIQNFLKRIYTQVDTTIYCEDESEIIENIDLDQSHEENKKYEAEQQVSESAKLFQENRLKSVVFEAICQIVTLGQLKELISLFNPKIKDQIENLQQNIINLRKQNICLLDTIENLKRQKNKLSIKYKILENQTRIFQQNNEEISKNYAELMSELHQLRGEESGSYSLSSQENKQFLQPHSFDYKINIHESRNSKEDFFIKVSNTNQIISSSKSEYSSTINYKDSDQFQKKSQ